MKSVGTRKRRPRPTQKTAEQAEKTMTPAVKEAKVKSGITDKSKKSAAKDCGFG
jgi:hypothetical protein